MVVSNFQLNSLTVFPIRPDIRDLQSQLVNWRRRLHQYPELGFQEEMTAAFVCQTLTNLGIDYQAGVAKTGIVAIIDSPHPGPVLEIGRAHV